MAKIKIKDLDIYYEIHGKGKPIVFINGLATHCLAWYPILDELKKENQVLIFDNRGSGRTTFNDNPWTIEDMAQDTFELISKLEIKKPSIVGHSMGGAIAQCLAINYKDKIDKIILSSTSAKFNSSFLLAADFMMYLNEINIPLDKQTENIISWMYSPEFCSKIENIKKTKEAIINNPYPPTDIKTFRQLEALKNFDYRNKIKNIEAQTLILHGENDIICQLDEANYLMENIDDTSFISIKKSGHEIFIEHPKLFSKIILDFINEKIK